MEKPLLISSVQRGTSYESLGLDSTRSSDNIVKDGTTFSGLVKGIYVLAGGRSPAQQRYRVPVGMHTFGSYLCLSGLYTHVPNSARSTMGNRRPVPWPDRPTSEGLNKTSGVNECGRFRFP